MYYSQAMSTQRSIINISVPESMAKQISETAKEEQKTTSELMREAFRLYRFQKDWERIRMLGEKTAQEMGIETYEDIERIAG